MRKGEQWERILEAYHETYREEGRAVVFHAHPGVRRDKYGRIHYESEGPPDFFGYMAGRAVMFDAKDIVDDTFRFKNLPGHQALALNAASSHGAFTFLAVRCPAGR